MVIFFKGLKMISTTEVLTKNGFINIGNLSTDSEVAVRHLKGDIFFKKPTKISKKHVSDYKVINITSPCYNQTVGVEDDIFVVKGREHVISKACKIDFGTVRLLVGGRNTEYKYNELRPIDHLRLLMFKFDYSGINVSITNQFGSKVYKHEVTFNTRKGEGLQRLLNENNIDFYTKYIDNKTVITFYYLEQLDATLSWIKVSNYSPSAIDTMFGYIDNIPKDYLFGINSEVLNKIQIMCALSNSYLYMDIDNDKEWLVKNVEITKNNKHRIGILSKVEHDTYNGDIYNIDIDGMVIIIRQNNMVSVRYLAS